MRSPQALTAVAVFFVTTILVASALAGISQMTPKDAGARFGEAAGAALVCYGLKITPEAAKLRERFQGEELEQFDAQAAKILAAWRDTLDCTHADGPNDCKVSQQWSCKQALDEVGPSGNKVPGLVEPKN